MEQLSGDLPDGLTPAVKKCWLRLKQRIDQNTANAVAAADAEALIMAAHQLARDERMRKEAEKTPLTQQDERGIDRIHPLWAELRNSESQLRATLTVLMLTPRSRKSHKSSKPVGPVEGSSGGDPGLRLLG
jgi:hypothetical protein